MPWSSSSWAAHDIAPLRLRTFNIFGPGLNPANSLARLVSNRFHAYLPIIGCTADDIVQLGPFLGGCDGALHSVADGELDLHVGKADMLQQVQKAVRRIAPLVEQPIRCADPHPNRLNSPHRCWVL